LWTERVPVQHQQAFTVEELAVVRWRHEAALGQTMS
jgi:hypothetical protein